jgi:hypothetical protein
VTFFGLFTLRTEATSMFSKPLAERRAFHRSSQVGRRQSGPAQLTFTRDALVRLVGVLDPVLELAVFFGKPLCHDVEPSYRTIVTRWPEVNCLPDREFVGHR